MRPTDALAASGISENSVQGDKINYECSAAFAARIVAVGLFPGADACWRRED